MSEELYAAPEEPAWVLDLLPEVERAFEVTGASTPGWPDPRPDWDATYPEREAAYSRVLDPGKYRILETRLDAWVSVLGARGLAAEVEVDPLTVSWDGAVRASTELARVRRLQPTAPGALAIELGSTLVDGAPFGVDVAVVDLSGLSGLSHVGSLLEPVPHCGCDACDSGSAELLEVLDHWVMTVARGGVVHVRSDGAVATRRWDGSTSSGVDGERWLSGRDVLPDGAQVWRGSAWR